MGAGTGCATTAGAGTAAGGIAAGGVSAAMQADDRKHDSGVHSASSSDDRDSGTSPFPSARLERIIGWFRPSIGRIASSEYEFCRWSATRRSGGSND